ncbi:MAG TPA: putative peptidoglycan glycosyltransferase FtsW [Patescibacteria group bacterium]|nr:putative peptidoglycan glycosyltransferase FtsW [Patescibacteria group bacterium]
MLQSWTDRTDKSVVGRWWWSVDRWTLSALLLLSVVGIVLVSAASPAVAERIHLTPFYFVNRHIAFLVLSLGIMFGVSLLGRKMLWRTALVSLGATMLLMLATIFFGVEIKGATRWIHLFGFSLQPSEFAKPAFAVVSAWLMARHHTHPGFPGQVAATGIFVAVLGLLLLQPDLGMSLVLAAIWAVQIFLAGLPMVFVIVLGALGAFGIFAAYLFFPHVASRIDRFLDPAAGDNYQVQKSLDAFSNGGLFGTGPAHGQVKLNLPDAHADFIFAVCGEEMGLIAAVALVCIFGFILLRSVIRVMNSEDLFIVLGAGGLLTQFALQSLIHMGSSLQLLPAKGMTLPFISYGGSSLLSLGLGMGMLLSLTRKRMQGGPSGQWRNWTLGENNA